MDENEDRNRLISLVERTSPDQYGGPKEALEFVLKMGEDLERVLVIFHLKGAKNPSFSQGSIRQDYSRAQVNYDVDCFKLLFLQDSYVAVDEGGD
jgi:hypothetical protein